MPVEPSRRAQLARAARTPRAKDRRPLDSNNLTTSYVSTKDCLMSLTGINKPRPWVMILFGLFFLWGFGWETIGHRLLIQMDGTILASHDVPSTGAPRYATEYRVRDDHGKEQVFLAGCTDASLPRSMPIGTRIRKQRWHLDYERNGARIVFIEKYFYTPILACALGMVIWGCLILRREQE